MRRQGCCIGPGLLIGCAGASYLALMAGMGNVLAAAMLLAIVGYGCWAAGRPERRIP